MPKNLSLIGKISMNTLEKFLQEKNIDKSHISSIYLSSIITEIDNIVLTYEAGYKNLHTMSANKYSSYFSDISGILTSKDKTILIKYPPAKNINNINLPDSIIEIATMAFINHPYIRDINFNNVKIIGTQSCYKLHLQSNIILNKNIEYIYDLAFADSKGIETLSFEPDSQLKELYKQCFFNNYHIKNIDLNNCNQLSVLGEMAFQQCGFLHNINFNNCNNLHKIEESAFRFIGASWTDPPPINLIFPKSILEISSNAFANISTLHSIAFSPETDLESLVLGNDCFKDICDNLLVFREYLKLSSDFITSTQTNSTVHYTNTDLYLVDILDLNYIYPFMDSTNFTFENFNSQENNSFGTIFTTTDGISKMLSGLDITASDFKPIITNNNNNKTKFKISNIKYDNDNETPVYLSNLAINLKDINNLTGFNEIWFDYGNNNILVRYRRGVYTGINTKLHFKIDNVDDAVFIVLFDGVNDPIYTKTYFYTDIENNKVIIDSIDVDENKYYNLIVLFYEMNAAQNLLIDFNFTGFS